MKITTHLQDMPNHILEYQLFTPENINVVQMTIFAEKKIKVVLTLPNKMKNQIPIANLQDLP